MPCRQRGDVSPEKTEKNQGRKKKTRPQGDRVGVVVLSFPVAESDSFQASLLGLGLAERWVSIQHR
jgi:hypothetical protein